MSDNKNTIEELEKLVDIQTKQLDSTRQQLRKLRYHALETDSEKKTYIRQLIHPFLIFGMGLLKERHKYANYKIRSQKFEEYDKKYEFGLTFEFVYPEYTDDNLEN